MKKNRERSIGKLLYFTEQELEIIQNKMVESDMSNFSAYCREMLLTGKVKHYDFSVIKEISSSLPQYHIERLFIPERYVQRNVEHGSCAISLYPGWQYSYVPIGSEKTRKSISGAELAQSLGGVVQVGTSENSLARRVANVERCAGIANAQT